MSALAHYLEEAGIPSVAIALIRPQAERTRPPRALWVPFELGRPIGPPSDPAFQRRVILTALGMLELADGPVVLQDFPDDDPREAPDPHWHPPVPAAAPDGGDPAEFTAAFLAEVQALAPGYAWSCTTRERSTVGLSGLAPAAFADYIAAWLRGEGPASPVADMSAPLALRFAIDDLKAYALEAAIARGHPSSQQLGDWFWQESACGAAIRALRQRFLASGDERQQAVAAFFVPALRV